MTVSELVAAGERALAVRGVAEPRANAELLMAALLGCGRPAVRVQSVRTLNAEQERLFHDAIRHRGLRVPLAYVLGSQAFLDLELSVSSDVLIPRPETEETVDAAARTFRAARVGTLPFHVVDLGTGSGCIALALARQFPEASVLALDISPASLAVAEANARRHKLEGRVRFARADFSRPEALAALCPEGADLVASNPPYIPSGELAALEPEVLREPSVALDGGPDGLDALRAAVRAAAALLRPGGVAAFEFGRGQGAAVRELLERAGFGEIELRRDLQGEERIAAARHI